MGDKIDEYEPGDGCGICWGPGMPFGDYPTPKYVYITGSGFVGPCEVFNGTFVAMQSPTSPCLWEFDVGTAAGFWAVYGTVSMVGLWIPDGPECFFEGDVPCTKVFTVGDTTVVVS